MGAITRLFYALIMVCAVHATAPAEVLINEISIYGTTVELWNRGDARNMTGWRMEMIHQNSYGTLDTIGYAFAPGFTMPADGMVLIADEDEDDTGPLLYMGDHFSYFYEFSISLYDAGGAIADYMDTRGFNPAPPDSTVWTGVGVYRTDARNIRRYTTDDTDTYVGWTSSESSSGTPLAPNPGQRERHYDAGRYAGMVINETAYYSSGFYSYMDFVELWNRGDSLDMTGWRLMLGTREYRFPDGFTVRPGRVITVQPSGYGNDSTLVVGSSLRRPGTVELYDADSVLIDYLYGGYSVLSDAGKWFGEGTPLGSEGRCRYGDRDSDTPLDWVKVESVSDEGKLNPGQKNAAWLQPSATSYHAVLDTSLTLQETLVLANTGCGTLDVVLEAVIRNSSTGDTVTDWSWLNLGTAAGSMPAGSGISVPVTFDRTGETAGTYYADIVLYHNMRAGDTAYVIPCTLTVLPVSLISVPDSAVFGEVIIGGTDTAYVPVMNTGTGAVTVDSFVCGNPAFSAAATVPFAIAAYGTVTVPVAYEPAGAGSHTGMLTVYSGAGAATVALAGTGIDGPVLSVSVTGISAAVDSGDTFATVFTLTNTGTGTLDVAGYYDSHPVVINEIRNGTWVEFRNRGPECSLAGWQFKWTQANSPEDPEYTLTFTFPDTAVIPADGYIGVTDYYYYANSVFIDMDGPDFYGWITSYTLLGSSGSVVDYLERDIMRSARPAGARWVGEGLEFTSAYITRPGDHDTDSGEDWIFKNDDYLTKGHLNRTQTAGYRAPWLTLVPAVDTVLTAGQSVTVGAVLDARYAADGRYTDILMFANNGARPAEALPVCMTVGEQRYLAAIEDEIVFPDAVPYGTSDAVLYLYNPGSETTAVSGLTPNYPSLLSCGISAPVSVAGGETLAVPLTFHADDREYTFRTITLTVTSDAVNRPSMVIGTEATSAKLPPVITSVPPLQAVEGAAYAYRLTAVDAESLDTVSYSVAAGPAGLSVDGVTGSVSWMPDDADNGWVAVTLRASDGTYYSDQAFSVYVVPVNDAPAIVPVGKDTAYTQCYYVRYVNAADADDAVLTYSLDTAPSGMTISATGLMEWSPGTLYRDSTVLVAYRVADAETSVADTFSLHVRDLRLLRISADTVVCADEILGSGTQYNGFTLFNDGQHATTVSSVVFSNPSFSLFNAPPFGVSPGYSSTRYIRFRPAAMGTVTATATVYSDAMDHPVLQFTVSGTGLNTAPRITSTAVTAATEDVPYSYQLTADDDEIDTAFVYALATAPAGMSIDSTGLVTWTPVDSQYGANGVVVTVSDGFLADSQSFVITVARVNDPPVLAYEPVYDTAYYGMPYSYPVPATDEEGDSLSYSLSFPPAGMRVTDAGEIVWLPGVSYVGTWQPVVYSVSDGDSTVSSSFSLYIANEQRFLSASAETLLFPYTPVGQTSRCTLYLGNTGTANTEVSVTPVSNGVFRSLVGAPYMVMAGTSEMIVLSYTPAFPQEETGSITILSDAVDHPNITVVLRGFSARRAPYFASTPETSATEDIAYTYQVVAVDDDPGDSLIYSIAGSPAGMTVDAATGLLSWMPGAFDAGPHTVIVRVTDGYFNVDQEYTLNVAWVNDAPVITAGPAVDTTNELDTYILFTVASDEEDDSLRFGFIDSLPGMTIDGTGMILWNVPDGYGGFTYPVTYTVSDGEHTVQASYQLVVEDASGIHPTTAVALNVDAVLGGNPAGASVRFLLQLRNAAEVRCDVYSLNGQRVFGTGSRFASGAGQIVWQPEGAPGMYYYVISAGAEVITGSVVVR